MEENTKALEVNKEARAVKKQEDLDTKTPKPQNPILAKFSIKSIIYSKMAKFNKPGRNDRGG